MKEHVIKDSGQRQSFEGGMVRDVNTDKDRPDLVFDGPMFQRWVKLLTNGAKKYSARNWMKASGNEEYDRFLESAMRHFIIWFYWRKYHINLEPGANKFTEPVEDHAAASFFNINGVEYLQEQEDKERKLPFRFEPEKCCPKETGHPIPPETEEVEHSEHYGDKERNR